ncbi:MAG: DUF882 domain-containing protein [Gemmatimonadota bacterium]|nr:DUF882 domain-containing protein [Gemmatimonadota bacterium]
MEERRSSSTGQNLRSTGGAKLLAFPESRPRGFTKPSGRGEKIFNAGSILLLVVFAMGWSWSIARARAAGDGRTITPATAKITSALTQGRAPSAAYLTDAALAALSAPARGESGRLRVRIQQPGTPVSPILADTLQPGTVTTFSSGTVAEPTSGYAAPRRAGIWNLAVKVGNAIKPLAGFTVITLRPAAETKGGRLGLYYIGNWPTGGKGRPGVNYDPPTGFIEVTPETQNTPVSDHFKLRDFFPKDQQKVWPKYIVVDTKLIDKLELILSDLESRGINPAGVKVMSGFRTPQYNSGVGDTRGRASLSRHMYGDAADIFIDNDGNGAMDDLNKDGRVNIADAAFIREAALRVERAHPSLIGGIGVYSATSAHGPFTHIDTRGYSARW